MSEGIKEIRNARDFGELAGKLTLLVGLPCLRAEFAFADELVLHFGDPVPYRHPKLAERTKGTWVLSTVGTPWVLQSPGAGENPPFALLYTIWAADTVPASRQVREAALKTVEGIPVAEARIDPESTDLFIRFNNGVLFQVLSKYAAAPDLPAWELQAPGGMFIQVWGGVAPAWSFLRSDVPAAW